MSANSPGRGAPPPGTVKIRLEGSPEDLADELETVAAVDDQPVSAKKGHSRRDQRAYRPAQEGRGFPAKLRARIERSARA
jgi:hypothetical protein